MYVKQTEQTDLQYAKRRMTYKDQRETKTMVHAYNCAKAQQETCTHRSRDSVSLDLPYDQQKMDSDFVCVHALFCDLVLLCALSCHAIVMYSIVFYCIVLSCFLFDLHMSCSSLSASYILVY